MPAAIPTCWRNAAKRRRVCRRLKLSFKDKHALASLPGEISQLQAEMLRQQAVLADAGLFVRDPKRFDAATRALSTASAALEAAEEKWLALEMLRESLES
jgi:ATP-binding cassette subfamily F protein uup